MILSKHNTEYMVKGQLREAVIYKKIVGANLLQRSLPGNNLWPLLFKLLHFNYIQITSSVEFSSVNIAAVSWKVKTNIMFWKLTIL